MSENNQNTTIRNKKESFLARMSDTEWQKISGDAKRIMMSANIMNDIDSSVEFSKENIKGLTEAQWSKIDRMQSSYIFYGFAQTFARRIIEKEQEQHGEIRKFIRETLNRGDSLTERGLYTCLIEHNYERVVFFVIKGGLESEIDVKKVFFALLAHEIFCILIEKGIISELGRRPITTEVTQKDTADMAH